MRREMYPICVTVPVLLAILWSGAAGAQSTTRPADPAPVAAAGAPGGDASDAAARDAAASDAGEAMHEDPSESLAGLTREEMLQQLEIQQARLALDQAKSAMDKAQAELDDIRALFAENLKNITDLNRAEQDHDTKRLLYRQAQIDLRKKRLDFLKNATLVSVVSVKKVPQGNEERAIVTIRNDSAESKARIALGGEEEIGPEQLASLLSVDNIRVALLDGAVSIGKPYQRRVDKLTLGQEVELEFTLLKEGLEHVSVGLEFLGEKQTHGVRLMIDAGQAVPQVACTQRTLIGSLGTSVQYGLTLKRLGRSEEVYSLIVLGLPPTIPFSFRSTGSSQATLQEVHFNEKVTEQALSLDLSIPERFDPNAVDVLIPFTFLAIPSHQQKKLSELIRTHGQQIPLEELSALHGAVMDLAVTPRGTGKLEISAPNLFTEVREGEPIELKFNVVNTGTLALREIRPELDLPLEWECTLEPANLRELLGGEKALFKVRITPVAGATVGEYAVRVEAEGHSGMEVVDAPQKDFTIRIASKGNLTGTAVLVGVLVLLVVGIAVASVKISRR